MRARPQRQRGGGGEPRYRAGREARERRLGRSDPQSARLIGAAHRIWQCQWQTHCQSLGAAPPVGDRGRARWAETDRGTQMTAPPTDKVLVETDGIGSAPV